MKKWLIPTLALSLTALALGQAQQVTLEQWYHQYGEAGTQQAVQRYAADYSKKTPNVKVNVSWIPGNYSQKLNAAMLSGTGPDVFEDASDIYTRAKAGQIVPLDDLFTAQDKKDFGPILSTVTYKGKIYAVPMIMDTIVLYYRKSAFTKAGVKPPTTYAELLAAAKKLTTGGQKGLFIGNDGGVAALATWMPVSAGVPLVQGNKVTFDNPRTVKAFEALRALNQSGVLLKGAPQDFWDPTAFNQGLTAMQINGLWALPAVEKALGDDFGVLPWPKLDAQGKSVMLYGSWNIAVNAKSKNVAAAKALVKAQWIQNTALQAEWATAYGFHLPPRASATQAAAKLSKGNAAEVVRLNKTYGQLLPEGWGGGMQTALNDVAAQAVNGNQPLAPLVKAAAAKAQAEYAQRLK